MGALLLKELSNVSALAVRTGVINNSFVNFIFSITLVALINYIPYIVITHSLMGTLISRDLLPTFIILSIFSSTS